MKNQKQDLIISINVHEKIEYLFNQIENINEHVQLRKKIVLNCNEFMFNELKNLYIQDVEIFPFPLNKRRFHGSLTHGIVNNMMYSLKKYDFNYFLILSSRSFFYRKLNNLHEIEKLIVNKQIDNKHVNFDEPNIYSPGEYCKVEGNYVDWGGRSDFANLWWWPNFSRTKLYKYIEKNNKPFAHSMHEGLCFDKKSCEFIANFLLENEEIKNDLFAFEGCVEEFALQSIVRQNNNYFFYIGNGCGTHNLQEVEKDKFIYKKIR